MQYDGYCSVYMKREMEGMSDTSRESGQSIFLSHAVGSTLPRKAAFTYTSCEHTFLCRMMFIKAMFLQVFESMIEVDMWELCSTV